MVNPFCASMIYAITILQRLEIMICRPDVKSVLTKIKFDVRDTQGNP